MIQIACKSDPRLLRFMLCRQGALFRVRDGFWTLKTPWARAFYSERNGYHRPRFRLLGWRLFFTRSSTRAPEGDNLSGGDGG